MIDAVKMKRSIYFATLQGYVIFETELYCIGMTDGKNGKVEKEGKNQQQHLGCVYGNVLGHSLCVY